MSTDVQATSAFSESSEKPEEDYLDAPLASRGQRVGAFLIDALLCVPVSMVPVFGGALCLAYTLLRDSLPFLDGQSVGKKIVGIRAVDRHGASLSGEWGTGIVRNVVFLIPFFALIELIVLLARDDQRRLGDQWAGTFVIREPVRDEPIR